MKKLTFFLFVLNWINCYPQAFPLKIKISDSNHVDSVLFGLKYESTIGVDTLLGENNVIDKIIDSFEIRVIQRDESNFNCSKIYAPTNLDLKVDYRPIAWGGLFSTLNNNFEFLLKSDFYPYEISGDFSNIGFYNMGSRILLLDSTCKIITETYPYGENQIIDTIKNSGKYYLVVHLEHEVGVNNYSKNQQIEIFPNPTEDFLLIEGFSDNADGVSIADVSGVIYSKFNIDKQKRVLINLQELKSGIYIVTILDKNKRIITNKLIVKK